MNYTKLGENKKQKKKRRKKETEETYGGEAGILLSS